MSEERWRQIEGWPYSVSDRGRVRNDRTGKILVPVNNGNGYMRVFLHSQGEGRSEYVHRLVLKAFKGDPARVQETNHINGDKSNNRLENLEWVTSEENNQHAVEAGLRNEARGENVGTSKLAREDVLAIRHKYEATDVSTRKLAREYGVDHRAIGRIVNGEQWSHVGGPIRSGGESD